MLTIERKEVLLDRLMRDGRLVAVDLAAEFGISEDTVRRDLRALAQEGRLLRVHGGALPLSGTHVPLAARADIAALDKVLLGQVAARRLKPGQTVIMDGGTTSAAVVLALPRDMRLTIVTHSPGVAAMLEHHREVDVFLIGGRVFRHSMVALGPTTQDGYAQVRADMCILGVTGVHVAAGLTTGDPEEAQIKRTMMAAAGETMVLATPDKLGVASAWRIAPLVELTSLVTTGARPEWLPQGVEHIPA